MSQFVSWFLSSLGNILPFQSDTTPSKCPYIVNRGKEGEYICGVMSQSGRICAKHKNRRPQVQYSDKEAEEEEEEEEEGEEEEETPPTERSKNKGRRTRESTPQTSTPSRPKTAPSKPASPSATKTPTHPRTPRNKPSSTSATDTPISAEPNSAPRRSTRKQTPEATPKPASTPKLRSSLPGADSTPPTSTGKSSHGIEKLTGRLKEMNVEDEDDTEAIPSGREWSDMPKRVNTTESVVSYGPRNPYRRGLENYLMKDVHSSLVGDLIKNLSVYPTGRDGEGYVYIIEATPVQSLQMTTGNKKRSTRAPGGDINSEETMIVKVGSTVDPDLRMKSLRGDCGHFLYKLREVFPKQKTVKFRYKAEAMVLLQLKNWRYRPEDGCLCGREHRELFEVTKKQLESTSKCINHWTRVINRHHEKLWPGAVEMNSPSTDS